MNASFKNITTVTKYTFLELYKSKIMVNVIFLGLFVILISFIARELTYGVPVRVTIDIGFGLVTLSSIGISIFMGVGIISKEVESRTIYMILGRSVKRSSFVLGRFFGISSILFINIILLSSLVLLFVLQSGGKLDQLMFWSILFIFIEALIVLSIVIFFSLIANQTLSVIFTLASYVVGHGIGPVKTIRFVRENTDLLAILNKISFFIPDLGKLNIKSFLLYDQSITSGYLRSSLLYGCCYTIALMLFSITIFKNKNLD